MSDDKRQGMGQAGEERSEERSALKVDGSEPAQSTEQPQPQPAQHKGRGGARPGAGRKAKWGEKTVVMRVPVSMRAAVEEFLAGKASGEAQAVGRPGEEPSVAVKAAEQAGNAGFVQAEECAGKTNALGAEAPGNQGIGQAERAELQIERAVAEALAAAAAAWEEERARDAASHEAQRAAATAAWDSERAELAAQLEDLRAQLVLAESQREALLAQAEHRLDASAASSAAPAGQGSSDSASAAAASEGLAPDAAAPAVSPVVAALSDEPTEAAPKPKKPRAPRKKKAQDKAGAVDPSRQISLFDLLGDDD